MSDIFKDVSDFESRLGLPSGFYEGLIKEDDWSFVIKISALFEAASTHLLSVRFRAPEVESELAFLEQANPRNGKIVLLEKMDAIYKDQANFLTKLAGLRNQLAHKIENVNFNFPDYISNLDKHQLKSFVAWAGHGVIDETEFKGKKVTRHDLVTNNPKMSIWVTAAEVLACMNLDIQGMEVKMKMEAFGWYQSITS
ncbi:hypothetical protein MTF68_05830 [Pseudoalteromonas sp. 2CM37A]|uniref:hypothetical protein n=1 Tax=Pseudoalteromonas sp. 2CM37A TaxID=2929853 RepID=UPI0020C0F6F6|nr:hypothetical protein [Pseudoalteromonas sp. 2CM37A]MCK8117073.1 hypothetical protein [Pseudoalteromonas sp. 2CM37A]